MVWVIFGTTKRPGVGEAIRRYGEITSPGRPKVFGCSDRKFFHGFPWFSYGFYMVFHGFHMVFTWFSMVFIWFLHGFP